MGKFRIYIQFAILILFATPLSLLFQNCSEYNASQISRSKNSSLDNTAAGNSSNNNANNGGTDNNNSSNNQSADGTTTPVDPGTPVSNPMDPNPTPLGQTGSWQLLFADEFETNKLDLTVWEPSWFAGNAISPPINSDEDACYDPAQVTVSGGYLRLAAATSTKSNCKTRSNTVASYASGLVNTRKSYLFAYGYVEARVYLPGSNQQIYNWPAVWTDGTGSWPSTGEIDIMEGLSDHTACWHYHYLDGSGNHQGPGGCAPLADPTGWHTFAVHWQPGKLTYYYDGVKVGTWTTAVISSEHFIILNYGINDRYGIHAPATMLVDYIRVWKSQ